MISPDIHDATGAVFLRGCPHRKGDDGVAFHASLEREIFSFSSIIFRDRPDRVCD
jgi:hypothetical protein